MLLESHFVLPTSALGMMDVRCDSGYVCDQVPERVKGVGRSWLIYVKVETELSILVAVRAVASRLAWLQLLPRLLPLLYL